MVGLERPEEQPQPVVADPDRNEHERATGEGDVPAIEDAAGQQPGGGRDRQRGGRGRRIQEGPVGIAQRIGTGQESAPSTSSVCSPSKGARPDNQCHGLARIGAPVAWTVPRAG